MIDLEYFLTIVGALSEYHNKTMNVRALIKIELPLDEGEGYHSNFYESSNLLTNGLSALLMID
jgi:hypothetical protein